MSLSLWNRALTPFRILMCSLRIIAPWNRAVYHVKVDNVVLGTLTVRYIGKLTGLSIGNVHADFKGDAMKWVFSDVRRIVRALNAYHDALLKIKSSGIGILQAAIDDKDLTPNLNRLLGQGGFQATTRVAGKTIYRRELWEIPSLQ